MMKCSFALCYVLLHPKRAVLTCADCEEEVDCCVTCAAESDLCPDCKRAAEVASTETTIQTIVREVRERGFTFSLHNLKAKAPKVWAEHHRSIMVKEVEVDLTFDTVLETCFYGILDTHVGNLIAREFVTKIKEPDFAEKFDMWAATGFDKAALKKLLKKDKDEWRGQCTLTFYVLDTKERLQKVLDTRGWGYSMADHGLPVNTACFELTDQRYNMVSSTGPVGEKALFGLMEYLDCFKCDNKLDITVFASWTN